MSEGAAVTGEREHAERPGADRAAVRAGRRGLVFVTVVLLAHLPLLLLHLGDLWQFRPHYRYFPILLIAVGWLFWRRVRFSGQSQRSWWAASLLAAGLLTLVAAMVFLSPWLAAVATLLSLGGLIGRYAIPGQARDWLPAWVAMWLIVPPPRQWDVRLIEAMQGSALQTVGRLFDILSVRHLMEGNVLVLPGYRIPAEQACEGVGSLVLLLIGTALYVVVTRLPVLRSILLLSSVFAWVWLANVVRGLIVGLSLAQWQFDWRVDSRSDWLGYATILLVVVLLVSTDRLLAFLLRPIAAKAGCLPLRPETMQNPLTRAWNWLAGFTQQIGSPVRPQRRRRRARGRSGKASGAAVGGGVRAALPSGSSGRYYPWLAAFGLLGVVQIAGFALAANASSSIHQPMFSRQGLPEELQGWTLTEFQQRERAMLDPSGRSSSQWRYHREPLACQIAIEYPFSGWYELTRRYTASGWQPLARRLLDAQGEPDPEGVYVEVELSMPTGEYGWLLFGLLDQRGHDRSPVSDRDWRGVLDGGGFHTLGVWLREPELATIPDAAYLIQAFVTSSVELSSEQRDDLRGLFLAVRSRGLAASLGAASLGTPAEAETKP